MDGASRVQRIWHVDIPAILPTVITMLIFNCASVVSIGFDKVYLMQNSQNRINETMDWNRPAAVENPKLEFTIPIL